MASNYCNPSANHLSRMSPSAKGTFFDSIGSMLSKKVFLTGEPNFSAPPVHAARADVGDHLESQEGDHRASYAPDRGLQKRRQANIVFREISKAAQFSTFLTVSAISGPRRCSNRDRNLVNAVSPRCRSASRRAGLPIGGRNHFLTLRWRKSRGGWFFLIGIRLPSAPSIYRAQSPLA